MSTQATATERELQKERKCAADKRRASASSDCSVEVASEKRTYLDREYHPFDVKPRPAKPACALPSPSPRSHRHTAVATLPTPSPLSAGHTPLRQPLPDLLTMVAMDTPPTSEGLRPAETIEQWERRRLLEQMDQMQREHAAALSERDRAHRAEIREAEEHLEKYTREARCAEMALSDMRKVASQLYEEWKTAVGAARDFGWSPTPQDSLVDLGHLDFLKDFWTTDAATLRGNLAWAARQPLRFLEH